MEPNLEVSIRLIASNIMRHRFRWQYITYTYYLCIQSIFDDEMTVCINPVLKKVKGSIYLIRSYELVLCLHELSLSYELEIDI